MVEAEVLYVYMYNMCISSLLKLLTWLYHGDKVMVEGEVLYVYTYLMCIGSLR